jgi:hypothetical protein
MPRSLEIFAGILPAGDMIGGHCLPARRRAQPDGERKMSLCQADLNQFTSSENWYRHPLVSSITYTDGVKYMADTAGAHWLLDKIATLQMMPAIKTEPFQVWRLVVRENRTAILSCDDGNDAVVYSEEITFTDFPLDEIKLYCTDNVILLPSEY